MGNKKYDKLYAYYHLATAVAFVIHEATGFEKNKKSTALFFPDIQMHFKEGFERVKECQSTKQELAPFKKFYEVYMGPGGVFQFKNNEWKAYNPSRWKTPEMLEALKAISVVIKDLNKDYLSSLPDLPASEVKLTEESPEADKKKHTVNMGYYVSRGAFAMNAFFEDLVKNKERIYGFDTVQGKAFDIFYQGVFGEGEGAIQAELEAIAERKKQTEEEKNKKENEQAKVKKEPEKPVEPKQTQKPVEPKKEKVQPKAKPKKQSVSIGEFFRKFFSIIAFPFVKAGQGIWWLLKHIGFGIGKFFSWIWLGICYCGIGIGKGFKAIFVSDDDSHVGLWFGLSILLCGVMFLLGFFNLSSIIANFFDGLMDVNFIYSSFSITKFLINLNQMLSGSLFLIWILLLIPILIVFVAGFVIDLLLIVITAVLNFVVIALFFILKILFQFVLPFALGAFFIYKIICTFSDSDRTGGQVVIMILSILLCIGSVVFFYI